MQRRVGGGHGDGRVRVGSSGSGLCSPSSSAAPALANPPVPGGLRPVPFPPGVPHASESSAGSVSARLNGMPLSEFSRGTAESAVREKAFPATAPRRGRPLFFDPGEPSRLRPSGYGAAGPGALRTRRTRRTGSSGARQLGGSAGRPPPTAPHSTRSQMVFRWAGSARVIGKSGGWGT